MIARFWTLVKRDVVGKTPLARINSPASRASATAFFGEVDVPPAGETVGEVPLALAVADEDQLGIFSPDFRAEAGRNSAR